MGSTLVSMSRQIRVTPRQSSFGVKGSVRVGDLLCGSQQYIRVQRMLVLELGLGRWCRACLNTHTPSDAIMPALVQQPLHV